jgi:3-deoxy-D-manno-octulosonate 8-phosphate phosphatase (KDO 8-P phosphatase)
LFIREGLNEDSEDCDIMKLSIDQIDALVFDFDGVLTDNHVYINQDGNEWVRCNRSDGLGFNVLTKLKKPTYILSSEKNPVVSARGKKLNIPVIQNVSNKFTALNNLVSSNNYSLKRIFYVGNDLNDFHAMSNCGYSACPADSHPKIKEIATFNLNTKGGMGIVREILENLLEQDIMYILYEENN